MKQVATFYTVFWIFYFPTCIAFNTLPGFSSIDEAMTFVLIGYTFMTRHGYGQNSLPWKEYYVFLSILAFYIIYSLIWGENVLGAIELEFLQQIRPFSIIYCTWILNPQFTNKQKRLMKYSVVITLIAKILVNDEGYGGQADLSIGQMAICAGMTWYLFSKDTKRNRIISVFWVLLGLIAATKSKFVGEIVCFIAIIFFMRNKIELKSSKMIVASVVLGSIVLFFVWDKFSKYYIEGMALDGVARAETLRTAYGKILWDYIPFGPGMGTFATNGAWKFYSPLYMKYELNHVWGLDKGGGFICDIFYPSLVQYGIVGVFLFIVFWNRRLNDMNKINDLRYFRIALMAFLCLAIEQVADSTWLSGKGMGYCMLIGLCLNTISHQYTKHDSSSGLNK